MLIPEIAGTCLGTCWRQAICRRGLISMILHDNGAIDGVFGLPDQRSLLRLSASALSLVMR